MVCHHCEQIAKKHGKDRKGIQRFRCTPCNRTFTEYQDEPLEGMYLPLGKAVLILNMLLEGMSLRSTSRLTGVEMHTILKLLILAGNKTDRLMADKIRGLKVNEVQADELWGFIKCKGRTKQTKQLEDDSIGSCYTYVGMESDSKLVLCYHLGWHREQAHTVAFIEKLAKATTDEFQLSTDAMPGYRDAVIFSELGERVRYAQLIKIYESGREQKITAKRYSPTKFIKAIPKSVWGNPDMDKLCTSHIERLNLSIRTQVKRLARLPLSFSKKGRKPCRDDGSILRVLQFRSTAQIIKRRDTCDGSRDREKLLDFGGFVTILRTTQIYSITRKRISIADGRERR